MLSLRGFDILAQGLTLGTGRRTNMLMGRTENTTNEFAENKPPFKMDNQHPN